jgi:hypothetical protein
MEYDAPNQTRLLAKIVRDVLARKGVPETRADLTDAVKSRCARLKISVSSDDLTAVYGWIGSQTALTRAKAGVIVPAQGADPSPLSAAEAKQIYTEIFERYRAEHGMPSPARLEKLEAWE